MVAARACSVAIWAFTSSISPRDSSLSLAALPGEPNVSRLALYLRRFVCDVEFAGKELARMRKGSQSDASFQRNTYRLFALAATECEEIAADTYEFVSALPRTQSARLTWLRKALLDLTEWAT